MKTLTDTTPSFFEVNCILSPVKGEQVFENIRLPLEYGEKVTRAFLEGWAEAKGITLAKVSMCVYDAGVQGFKPKSVKWFMKCNGKLWFNQDQLG